MTNNEAQDGKRVLRVLGFIVSSTYARLRLYPCRVGHLSTRAGQEHTGGGHREHAQQER